MALASLAVSLFAVIVAVISFEVNRRSARDAERHGRMPVLVARGVGPAIGIRNIGNGPALNVVVAHATGEVATRDALAVELDRHQDDGTWFGHMHLQPVSTGAEQWYAWSWGSTRAIGVTYTDALGHPYTVVSSRFGTKVVDSFEMSHPSLAELDYPELVDGPSGM